MTNVILPLLIAASCATFHIQADGKHCPCSSAKRPSLTLLAESHADEDPHGTDPHDDPHDDAYGEQHDSNMPANAAHDKYQAPQDPYGGQVPNDHKPY